jgi:hypothetical protein
MFSIDANTLPMRIRWLNSGLKSRFSADIMQ